MQKPKHLEKFLQEIILDESESEDRSIYLKAKNMLQNLRNSNQEKVCLLKRALYGLKQAGRQWFIKLDEELRRLGFQSSHADPCIYVLLTGGDKVIMAVYVDDIIIASSNCTKLNDIKRKLMDAFEIRDLENLEYCLGIKFDYEKGSIQASQTKYIEELLNKFNMNDCKPVVTPMEPEN